jgi:hypothetical protein
MLLVVEGALNFMVKPSQDSSGMLMDIQLPPLNILPPDYHAPTEEQRNKILYEWYNSLVVNNRKITNGDLWGVFREDALIGYVPKESTVSPNGWWQSNNLGARARQDIPREQLPNKRRVLFFGDSFTQGSRVPQEETIQHYINAQASDIEAVNFGVDGYGMGQAYLRYTTLKDKLKYDHVLLIFVPIVDLWRNINVSREIGENWDSYMIYPRFIVEHDRLKLIASPYSNLKELADDNRDYIKPKLKQHLQEYESFYFQSGYQPNAILDWSVMYRLYKAILVKIQRHRLLSSIMNPDSEAMLITKKIVEAMDGEVREEGSHFSLVFLPTPWEIKSYSHDKHFNRRWQKMVSFICVRQINCIDLMGYFQKVPLDKLDSGYDGGHYGPVSNKLIADFIMQSIRPEEYLGSE